MPAAYRQMWWEVSRTLPVVNAHAHAGASRVYFSDCTMGRPVAGTGNCQYTMLQTKICDTHNLHTLGNLLLDLLLHDRLVGVHEL